MALEFSSRSAQKFSPLFQESFASDYYENARRDLEKCAGFTSDEVTNFSELVTYIKISGYLLAECIAARGIFYNTLMCVNNRPIGGFTYIATKDLFGYAAISTIDSITLLRLGLGDRKGILTRIHIPRPKQDKLFNFECLFANELRDGKCISYKPHTDTRNPELRNGYVKVLREFLNDFVDLFPPSTQVPQVFRDAFGDGKEIT